MEFDIVTLGVVIGMMVLANRLVAALVTPLFDKYGWDKFWLMYPAWILAGVLVWLTGVNLFAAYIPNELIGKILTAIVAGGGSNLLHDLTDKPDNLAAVFNMLEDEDEGVFEKIDFDEHPVGTVKDENGIHLPSGKFEECGSSEQEGVG